MNSTAALREAHSDVMGETLMSLPIVWAWYACQRTLTCVETVRIPIADQTDTESAILDTIKFASASLGRTIGSCEVHPTH